VKVFFFYYYYYYCKERIHIIITIVRHHLAVFKHLRVRFGVYIIILCEDRTTTRLLLLYTIYYFDQTILTRRMEIFHRIKLSNSLSASYPVTSIWIKGQKYCVKQFRDRYRVQPYKTPVIFYSKRKYVQQTLCIYVYTYIL